ncbi:MAG: hypothetical protein G01um101420_498 [Parcubacteria group bacterium Gr01-1014_20]|nr:MAG: hypothetical protein G01um101420_498 [Parcubacteria group bacterium Gr01-1014_20]
MVGSQPQATEGVTKVNVLKFYVCVILVAVLSMIVGVLLLNFWTSTVLVLLTMTIELVVGVGPAVMMIVLGTAKSLVVIAWFVAAMLFLSRMCSPPGPLFRW